MREEYRRMERKKKRMNRKKERYIQKKEGREGGRTEGRKGGRKEQRNVPRIKLLIAPTTNDVKTARPLSHRYDIL